MKEVIVLVLFGVVTAAVNGDCGDGFIRYHEFCYHFSHDRETWIDAKSVCNTLLDGRLAEITDPAAYRFLAQEIVKLNTDFWIGADDILLEGEWKWVSSGDPVLNASAQNKIFLSNSGGNENCLEFHHSTNWNDEACSHAQRYICQKTSEPAEIVG
ncbi:perlucin-like protein [Mya arenaria]|uniref:perlucin-like protein n=1 Tax=Mya arenaria TaxID=6604 RepID=UPI0022E25889|nr:perlucin-like protein [Mya arenaria]